ncbi:polyphosphate polymerase domain-containing protein [Planomicrobium sp. YIM 101495]|uniref:polyphosphate polymerase domain-containing protein n=1 Tax=Planomicrobium sp. YIM 101495 TaxID=2665160 RepID=UPI0012B743EE|nr:polyphosphate polymerase domain-containing protein [Planomicrobium sp. YIM 101495]MTD29786.1 VTC domain-containing protein [Planomicrobium sp. YIM 101495]
MVKEVFKRYELKYLISFEQYISLREHLLEKMKYDAYGTEGKYNIVSLYYDSDDSKIYYETRNKLRFRQKLRLRIYDQADETSTAFIEVKQKFKNVVNKRRTALPLNEAYELLNAAGEDWEQRKWLASNEQILKEAMHFKSLYDLRPELVVSYDRQAFSGIDEPDLRVTFDYNLMCRTDDLRIENGPEGQHFIDRDNVVLEVKVSETVPFWLSRLLSEHGCSKQSVSKFCTSVELMADRALSGQISTEKDMVM